MEMPWRKCQTRWRAIFFFSAADSAIFRYRFDRTDELNFDAADSFFAGRRGARFGTYSGVGSLGGGSD